MAYNPNIPAPTNRVQDDIAAMRGNFQHLAPLAQAVDELQTVSALAPYVQALVGSRIVEMGSNANGAYVRWENGLQVCMAIVSVDLSVSGDNNFPYPATFDGSPLGAGGLWGSTTSPPVRSAFKDSLVMRDSYGWRVHVGTTT